MGRKGGGRASFVKSARRGAADDTEDDTPPQVAAKAPTPAEEKPAQRADVAQAKPVISAKAAAFLVDTPSATATPADADVDSDEAPARNEKGETRGQMMQRHKREAKALKEQVKKLGKKGKDEAAKLEAELGTRHAAEVAELESIVKERAAAIENGDDVEDKLDADALAESLEEASLSGQPAPPHPPQSGSKKLTKAQRRRDQRAAKEAEREARIAAEIAELGETERAAEERQLREKLAPLGFDIRDIPPDGHCLYRSLEDQLALANAAANGNGSTDSLPPKSYVELRRAAADYIRGHADAFRPFVLDSDAATASADAVAVEEGKEVTATDPLEAYCIEIAETAAWGGQVEIQALSQALKAHIQVHSVGLPLVEVGEEFKGTGPTLRVCYLRHAYGLGEHFNSVVEQRNGEGEDAEES